MTLLLGLTSCGKGITTGENQNGPIPTSTPTMQTNSCQAIVTPSVQPELFGLWVKELNSQRNLSVFTNDSVYLLEVEENNGDAYIRESFYEVQSIDWVRGELTLNLSWVRVNGKYGGFDSPLKYMKIYIDETSMYYGMGDEGLGMPTEATNGPWLKK